MVFSPTSFRADVGDVLRVDLVVVAGSLSVNNVEMHIDFDPALLQVVDIGSSPASEIEANLSELGTELFNEADNSTGRIRYHAGKLVAPSTGTVRVATVRFKVIEAGPTTVHYASESDVFYRGASVVRGLGSAEVTPTDGHVFVPTGRKDVR